MEDNLGTLIDDIVSLGIPTRINAYVHTNVGSYKVEIDYVHTGLNRKEQIKLENEFNEVVRCTRDKLGSNYHFIKTSQWLPSEGGIYAISSSLDELWELFKADRTNQKMPDRNVDIYIIFNNFRGN